MDKIPYKIQGNIQSPRYSKKVNSRKQIRLIRQKKLYSSNVSSSLLSCLSIAEILYLQRQKIVSKSYERKLKCLIKRKIDVLRKEIPLLSKLILEDSGKYEDIIYRIKKVGKLSSFDNHNSNNEINQQITGNQVTNYGNINSKNLQSGIKKIAAQEDLES